MWILQYILGTLDVRLKFVHDEYLGQWVGYIDSDFVGNLNKRCSTIEYLFLLEVS